MAASRRCCLGKRLGVRLHDVLRADAGRPVRCLHGTHGQFVCQSDAGGEHCDVHAKSHPYGDADPYTHGHPDGDALHHPNEYADEDLYGNPNGYSN